MLNLYVQASIRFLREAVQKSTELYCVFDTVSLKEDKNPQKGRNRLRPRILKADDVMAEARESLDTQLETDLTRLAKLHEKAQPDTLFHLFQKYGWRIASPDSDENAMPDAAFCDSFRVEKALENKGGHGYLLIKGDLSGIQEFIYGGIQQGTAGGLKKLSKRLRGRSIQVSLLTDFLASLILKELGLPAWHLLFAGGGHFNLLLPNSAKMAEKWAELSKELDSEMRRVFGDRLSLILAQVECGDEIRENAGAAFERLNAEKEKQKFRRHRHSLTSHFFHDEKSVDDKADIDKDITLGQSLPKRNFLIETVSDEILPTFPRGENEVFSFKIGDKRYQLFAVEEREAVERFKDKAKSAQVFSINETDFIPAEAPKDLGFPISYGFRFLGKHVPTKPEEDDRPKTFEEIAFPDPNPEKPMTKQNAFLMVGAMRLDVDDLGCIFSKGLGKNASLAQIVTLSRELHYFFTAHFDHLAAQQKHDIYVIYSGGDDAFVVGRWDKLIAFSIQLQADFYAFTQRNTEVHFSAGIFMGAPHYPVGKFYKESARLEDEAKDRPDKNRVNLFNRNLEWTSMASKIEFGDKMAVILDNPEAKSKQKLTMAFAYRVLSLVKNSFHERSELDGNGNKVKRGFLNVANFGKNIAQMHYLFARHGYTQDQIPEILEEVKKALATDFLKSFNFGTDTKSSNDKINRVQDYLVAFNFAFYSIRSQKKLEKRQYG